MQPSEKLRENWGFNHSLFVERQEEIQLTHKINDTFSSCSTVIALAQLRAEQEYKLTKVQPGRKKQRMEEKDVYDRRLMEGSKGYIFPVFTSRERPKREKSIKADLIYEASLWLEAGKRSLRRRERDAEEHGGCLNELVRGQNYRSER